MRFLLCLFAVVCLSTATAWAEWVAQTSGVDDNLYGMYFLDEDYGYAVGWGASAGAVVLRTLDGGGTWTSSVPVEPSYLFGITFTDPQTGWAVGYDGQTSSALIISTADGGESWQRSVWSGSLGFYVVQFPTAQIGFACGYDGAIIKTTNGGESWTQTVTGTNEVFRSMHLVDTETGYAVCGESFASPDCIYKTTDGHHWSEIYDFGGTMVIAGIYFLTEDEGLIVGSDGYESIRRTTDGGESWEEVYNSQSSAVLQSLHVNGPHCWAVNDHGRVRYSSDFGITWEQGGVVIPPVALLTVFDAGDAVYCGGAGGRIFKNDLTAPAETMNPATLPDQPFLNQNYPNPFNPSTTITFDLPKAMQAQLHIFDVTGRLVATLADEYFSAGSHALRFDGSGYPSGMYFARLQAGSATRTQKLILLK